MLPTNEQPHTFWRLRTTQMGAGLVGAGIVLSAADLQTRQLRTDYLPSFRYRYDDYLQFSPLAITYGLKLCGVEGRSSWERLAISNGLSAGIMLSTVYVVKYGLGRLRPDGSTHNSFPSGHTAMAFTAATILHKEYGVTRSPWWSVAGYSLATITGISRSLNNRHWLSDIVVGAGVGILSTELGYWITDRLLGTRGIILPTDEWEPVHIGERPSFVGIGIAHNALLYDADRYERLAPSSIGFSIEGAWFFTPTVGVGATLKVGRYADLLERNLLPGASLKEPKPLNSVSAMGGIYYNHPLGQRLHLGAKALVGVSRNHTSKNTLVGENGAVVATIEHDNTEHLTATAGRSLRYVVADNLGLRLYADYNYIRTDYPLSPLSPSEIPPGGETSARISGQPTRHSGYQRPLTFGVAVDALLW
jgi:membrane-associated phospholipid phosphatase